MLRWSRVLALYSPSIVMFVVGLVILLTTTVTNTAAGNCGPLANGTTPCPAITTYVVNSVVPVLWIAAAVYLVVISLYLLTRGRWLITRQHATEKV